MKMINLSEKRAQFMENSYSGRFITQMQMKMPTLKVGGARISGGPWKFELSESGELDRVYSEKGFFTIEGRQLTNIFPDGKTVSWNQPLIFNCAEENVQIGEDVFTCSGILGLVYCSETDSFLMLPAKEPGIGDQVILRPIQTSVTRLKHTLEGLPTGEPTLKKVLETVSFDGAVCVRCVMADPARVVAKNLAVFLVVEEEIDIDGAVWVPSEEIDELCLYQLTNSFVASLVSQFKVISRLRII